MNPGPARPAGLRPGAAGYPLRVSDPAARRAVEAVWRIEASRLIAALAAFTRDLGLAEELAQDALVAALERWPSTGIPDNPGAWLTTTARNRAVDLARRRGNHDRKLAELGRDLSEHAPEHDPDDDLLNLVFTACHPVLSPDARVALTLRVVGGLTTEEIAGAFLVPESTAAQRIVRAKKALAKAGVRFETPPDEQRAERLGSVLGVLYLIFNEGYSATGGAHLVRPDLCATALRLGRVLVSLVPREPEAHGLLALMELQASRIRARTTPDGAPVRLLDQDRSRWDRLLITRGLAGLERAERLGGGPYTAQAAIAACHARAATAEDTDWVRVVGLYELLALRTPSPVIALNHAVACGMAFGPEVGLELVDELLGEKALAGYHLLPSARGDLLARLGRTGEARAEFERAAALTRNEPERAQLLARARECG